jgi:hypothetical protein
LCIYSGATYADEVDDAHAAEANEVPAAASYISATGYTENPYIGMPSGGGTQNVPESQMEVQNIAQKWFADGTWNVFGAASYVDQAGANNYGYAVNIFAQTGQVAGFSFGTFLTIANPFIAGINPSDPTQQAQGLAINEQITPQELFAEYQYSNILQVDAGLIGISNSPWLTFYQNNALNLVTYQGAMVNVHPGGGWLITGLALNGMQRLGQSGFSDQTFYNYNEFYNAGGLQETGTNGSSGTTALGASWSTASNDFNVRLWGYQFNNYANLAYADSNLKLPVNKDLNFTISAQGGIEGGNGQGNSNVFNQSGIGSVNSNFVGLQLGMNYDMFALQGSYNNIWGGGGNTYRGGGIVSPDTFGLATDPLYTTGWLIGMVELAGGSAYKVAPSLNLLDGNLQIGPSYEYFATNSMPSAYEYDLQIVYNIPQVKGLTIFGGYGYLFQDKSEAPGTIGNTYQGQIMVSYLY